MKTNLGGGDFVSVGATKEEVARNNARLHEENKRLERKVDNLLRENGNWRKMHGAVCRENEKLLNCLRQVRNVASSSPKYKAVEALECIYGIASDARGEKVD